MISSDRPVNPSQFRLSLLYDITPKRVRTQIQKQAQRCATKIVAVQLLRVS